MDTRSPAAPIVSLLPSATEILHFIGAGPRVIGCTHECDYPVGVASRVPHVTRSLLPPGLSASEIDAAVVASMRSDAHTIYALDTAALHRLRPRYIVTQKLCDVCAVPERAVQNLACSLPTDCAVVSADPSTLEELFDCIRAVGEAVGASSTESAVQGLERRLTSVRERTHGQPKQRVVVLEWPDPPYAPGHWVPGQIEAAGGICAIGQSGKKSVRVTWETLEAANAGIIVHAFCGFDLAENKSRLAEIEDRPEWKRIASKVRVYASDASSYFSRPGPRLIDGVELLAYMLHGDAVENLYNVKPGQMAELVDGEWVDLSTQ